MRFMVIVKCSEEPENQAPDPQLMADHATCQSSDEENPMSNHLGSPGLFQSMMLTRFQWFFLS
jgi:hypothetical protein